jgi:hypothetical protein
MKIILTMIVCSAVYQSCLEPMERPRRYATWAHCMRAGYSDSLEIMRQLGDAQLNSYHTYIKFVCSQKPVVKPKINGTNGKGKPI